MLRATGISPLWRAAVDARKRTFGLDVLLNPFSVQSQLSIERGPRALPAPADATGHLNVVRRIRRALLIVDPVPNLAPKADSSRHPQPKPTHGLCRTLCKPVAAPALEWNRVIRFISLASAFQAYPASSPSAPRQGFTTGTPRSTQSRSFRVTKTRPCTLVVASRRPSITGIGRPVAFPSAAMLPHSLAIVSSTGRSRPTNMRERS